jgi:phosphate starvation-inducible protein PhoH and related proteins
MKSVVQISRGIESLFGTRDENIRLIESNLNVRTRLLNDSLEIEGEDASVARAAQILNDYVALVREGHTFNNGDLNSFLRVVTADSESSLRSLVESGKQRTFGKKVIAPKSMTQRRYIDAIERYDLVFGIGPAKLIWPSPWPWRRCFPNASAVSSLRDRPSKPANAWGSCPARSRKK